MKWPTFRSHNYLSRIHDFKILSIVCNNLYFKVCEGFARFCESAPCDPKALEKEELECVRAHFFLSTARFRAL